MRKRRLPDNIRLRVDQFPPLARVFEYRWPINQLGVADGSFIDVPIGHGSDNVRGDYGDQYGARPPKAFSLDKPGYRVSSQAIQVPDRHVYRLFQKQSAADVDEMTREPSPVPCRRPKLLLRVGASFIADLVVFLG